MMEFDTACHPRRDQLRSDAPSTPWGRYMGLAGDGLGYVISAPFLLLLTLGAAPFAFVGWVVQQLEGKERRIP